MIITKKELINKYGSVRKANKAINDNKYSRVARGLYVNDSAFLSELEQIFRRFNNATLGYRSAFEYYDLSDYIPTKYEIVTNLKSHKINNPKVKQFYMSDFIINIGRKKVKTKYGHIYIYDKERMLIELIRLKNKFPHDYYQEVIKNYRKLIENGEIDFNVVEKYCSSFVKEKNLLSKIYEVALWK